MLVSIEVITKLITLQGPLNVLGTNIFYLFFQNHPYVKKSDSTQVDFAGWVCNVAGL